MDPTDLRNQFVAAVLTGLAPVMLLRRRYRARSRGRGALDDAEHVVYEGSDQQAIIDEMVDVAFRIADAAVRRAQPGEKR